MQGRCFTLLSERLQNLSVLHSVCSPEQLLVVRVRTNIWLGIPENKMPRYLGNISGHTREQNGHFGSCNLIPTVNLLPKESQVVRTHGALNDTK